MNQYPWHQHYAAAMLEPVPDQRLIAAAEHAIHARLKDSLRGKPVAHPEIQAAKYALEHLRLLKREAERLSRTN